jgi:hypothetical protein
MDTGKTRKTCVEVAGRSTFRTLPSWQQSGYIDINNIDNQLDAAITAY